MGTLLNLFTHSVTAAFVAGVVVGLVLAKVLRRSHGVSVHQPFGAQTVGQGSTAVGSAGGLQVGGSGATLTEIYSRGEGGQEVSSILNSSTLGTSALGTSALGTSTPSNFTTITVAGENRSIDLSAQLSSEVMLLIDQGNLIEAIKLVRRHTECDLTSAKKVVEGLQRVKSLFPRH